MEIAVDTVQFLPSIKVHKVIDVTLRDGGFQTDFAWQIPTAHAVIDGAFSSGAEFCELGYVGGLPELHNSDQRKRFAALSVEDIAQLVLPSKTGFQDRGFCVMRHPTGKEPLPSPDELHDAGVELVRFVYHPSWEKELIVEHQRARSAGLRTAINIALASKYSMQEIEHTFTSLKVFKPDIIYFADTCGSLVPSQVGSIVALASRSAQVGFHGHDYLSLAIANSLEAVEAGAVWIDTSVLGLGRGAGNARTEIWATLRAHATGTEINPMRLSRTIAHLVGEFGRPKQADWVAVVCGAANLTPPEEDVLRSSPNPSLEAAKVIERIAKGDWPNRNMLGEK